MLGNSTSPVVRSPLVAGFIGMVSLAIGAHAALNKRALDAAKAIGTEQIGDAVGKQAAPRARHRQRSLSRRRRALNQPINDARALTATLRQSGFDVDVVEDASQGRHAARHRPAEVEGQAGHRGDAVLRRLRHPGRPRELHDPGRCADLEGRRRPPRRHFDRVRARGIKEKGARAKLVVIDASRRNPYERRFRSYSHGLAPISAPDNALILTSATPGKVADDSRGQNSVLVAELLNNLDAQSPASRASSTRPASPSPAPPTASRCRPCRRRCWMTIRFGG